MPVDEEKVAPTSVDIFDQSLGTEEVEINPDANFFTFPPPLPESGNPYRVKILRGQKGWMSYPGKDGKPGYLATDLELRTIAPGDDKKDDKPLFDNFASTMVMQSTHMSKVGGIIKAIYETRNQGEVLPAKTTHADLARLLQAEFDKESEVGVVIQWEAYCEACSDEKKRVVVKGEKRFPQLEDGTHSSELPHGPCGSTLSAQAKVVRYVALK